MIRINSFLHRLELLELANRWFFGRLEPGDMRLLKALINFNGIWISRVGRDFSHWLFSAFHEQEVYGVPASQKGEVKDMLVEYCPIQSPRARVLIRRYKQHPQRYFRETPVSSVLYLTEKQDKPMLVGASRIKRVRRIAEKGGRRISDYLFSRIKKRADLLAQQRADSYGIPKSQLITSEEDMTDEFERAEHHIEHAISRGELFYQHMEFVLEDVLGAKIIAEPHEFDRVLDILDASDRCRILEVEHHRGRYNATNIVIDYTPDREKLLAEALSQTTIEQLATRGMNAEHVQEQFMSFVCEGEVSVHLELIVCDYQELLESEIGRSIHEDRIMRQRLTQMYRGHLARNVSYLMEYIFACGISPRTEIHDIPIQVWNRYMPDYFDEVIKDLFLIPRFRELE